MQTKTLPKFLIADNSQESIDIVYVVHTHNPKCIIECGLDGFFSDQQIYWLDEEPQSEDVKDELLALAERFYEDELENQEMLYMSSEDEE